MSVERRKVGERGQVTLPKELREQFGLRGGDEVIVHEEQGKIIIEKAITRDELAEGYRRRAADHAKLANELSSVSSEADEQLGDIPEWE